MNTPTSNRSGVSLQVRGLRKSFDGQEVLKGLDFEVDPENFYHHGPRGSGKHCLKHLIGPNRPTPAKSFINGESIHRRNCQQIPARARVPIRRTVQFADRRRNVGLYLSEHRLKPPEEIARIVAEKLENVGSRATKRNAQRTFPAA